MKSLGVSLPYESMKKMFEDDPKRARALEHFPKLIAGLLTGFTYSLEWSLLDLSEQGLTDESPAVIVWIYDSTPEEYSQISLSILRLREENREQLGGLTIDVRLLEDKEVAMPTEEIDRSKFMSLIPKEVETRDIEVYLFFLLVAKPSGVQSLSNTPGKLVKISNYLVTCETLDLKVISPTLEEGFACIKQDIQDIFSSRTPEGMTEFLLEKGYGLGIPTDNLKLEEGLLQTLMHTDPSFTYRMANAKVTIRTREAPLVPEGE